MRNRLVVMLLAAIIGVTFAIGLFVHGIVGGLILIAVDLVLITFASVGWSRLAPKARPLRVVVIAAIGVLGVVKLVHG